MGSEMCIRDSIKAPVFDARTSFSDKPIIRSLKPNTETNTYYYVPHHIFGSYYKYTRDIIGSTPQASYDNGFYDTIFSAGYYNTLNCIAYFQPDPVRGVTDYIRLYYRYGDGDDWSIWHAFGDSISIEWGNATTSSSGWHNHSIYQRVPVMTSGTTTAARPTHYGENRCKIQITAKSDRDDIFRVYMAWQVSNTGTN